jgi:hypothetical protein
VGERLRGVGFLIRDRDSKFSGQFDEVFRTEGVNVIKTPIRAPRANAFAERWVRTVGTQCLDWMLVLGRRQLERVLQRQNAEAGRSSVHGPVRQPCTTPLREHVVPWARPVVQGALQEISGLLDRRRHDLHVHASPVLHGSAPRARPFTNATGAPKPFSTQ